MIKIIEDHLEGTEIKLLIRHHLNGMKSNSPEESIHALDINQLKDEKVTFWSLWKNQKLAGCGALKELDSEMGEIKSMRTHDNFLRQGVAECMLNHIIGVAKEKGYKQLFIETGSSESFYPAHNLYKKYGFTLCGPFADYKEDPHSCFMTLYIQ